MRYAIMQNATPKGAVSLRFFIAGDGCKRAMRNRGSRISSSTWPFAARATCRRKRSGPACSGSAWLSGFADANAGTKFTHTVYQFDLPLADDKTVDNGLLRMRDTASELTLAQRAMDDELG